MCSALATCREPWNITCSNRCAKPVLPGGSCLEPDVVPEVDRHDRGEVVLGDDDAQAVVEVVVAERDRWGRWSARGPLERWRRRARLRISCQILAPAPDFRAGRRLNRRCRNRRRLAAMIPVTERPARGGRCHRVRVRARRACAVLGHAELKTATPAADSVQTKPVTEVSGRLHRLHEEGRQLARAVGSQWRRGGRGRRRSCGRHADGRHSRRPAGGRRLHREVDIGVASDSDIDCVASGHSPSRPAPSASPSAAHRERSAVVVHRRRARHGSCPAVAHGAAPSPSGDVSPTSGSSDVLLPIIVALILLGGGAAYLLNRRNRPIEPGMTPGWRRRLASTVAAGTGLALLLPRRRPPHTR